MPAGNAGVTTHTGCNDTRWLPNTRRFSLFQLFGELLFTSGCRRFTNAGDRGARLTFNEFDTPELDNRDADYDISAAFKRSETSNIRLAS